VRPRELFRWISRAARVSRTEQRFCSLQRIARPLDRHRARPVVTPVDGPPGAREQRLVARAIAEDRIATPPLTADHALEEKRCTLRRSLAQGRVRSHGGERVGDESMRKNRRGAHGQWCLPCAECAGTSASLPRALNRLNPPTSTSPPR